MPNGSVDDNGKAFDDLNLGTTRTELSNFERHDVSDYTRLTPDNE
jgi:hypothetical protein